MKIGIITAMTVEHEQVVKLLRNKREHSGGPFNFTEGEAGGNTLVLMQCGIGKVNAAAGAVELISRFGPDCIVSTGVAGGIDSCLKVMDVVVSRHIAYHDVWCGEGNEYGQVQGLPARFAGDETLLQCALALTPEVEGMTVHGGLICSGDKFITDRSELDSIKGNFVFEKDTLYQDIGNYFYPTQTVEKSLGRSFLRGQVNELGEMSLTSIYCAGGQLNHTSVKVSVGDLFAETPMAKDSYQATDLGRVIEKADYKLGEDGGVVGFIVANQDKNIQLQFIGDKTYRTAMPKNDRKAIVELTELARILSGMEEIRKQQKEANLKIQFVTRKVEEAKLQQQEN